jgi:hypothetical protein
MKWLKWISNSSYILGFLFPIVMTLYSNMTTTKIATYSSTVGGVAEMVFLLIMSSIFFTISISLKIFYLIRFPESRKMVEYVLILFTVTPIMILLNVIYN